ncbi:MAG: glucosyltransferase domain-containing protein [Alphaproteobacteria bacterium]|jgi:hypothetical protein|nr:glucosyltransferase domain-containing protein [Alphaproteobacteria bacterium]
MLSKASNNLLAYALKDIKENRNYYIFLLIVLAICFILFHFISAHDDIIYYVNEMNFINEVKNRIISESRFFYPIIVEIVNQLYLSYKVVLLFGFVLFYVNNFILIKLFFPNITKISWLFLSLLLIVNPFNIFLMYWSTMFFTIQLGIFITSYSYYVFTHTNLNIYLKVLVSALAIFAALNLMPVVFYIYITILFLSIFCEFLLDNKVTFKQIIKDKYLHVVYILLGILIFYTINKFLLFYLNAEQQYGGWRGEYIPIDSLSLLFARIKSVFFTLKHMPIYFYSIVILNTMLLIYSIIKKRTYFLSILIFICIFILMFISYISDILINIHGTNVRLNSIHYLFAILFMISLNVFNKYLVKILYVVLSIYILISISLIDRFFDANKIIERVNTYIYDKIELEALKLSSKVGTKIYVYGYNNQIFSLYNKREVDLFRFFSYFPDFKTWANHYEVNALVKNIGYSNVEILYNNNIDLELRNIIESKTQKDIIFPKEGSIFEYNGNIYVIFNKINDK